MLKQDVECGCHIISEMLQLLPRPSLVLVRVIGIELVNRRKARKGAICFAIPAQIRNHARVLNAGQNIACGKHSKAIPSNDMPDDLSDGTLIEMVGKRKDDLFSCQAIQDGLIATQRLVIEA